MRLRLKHEPILTSNTCHSEAFHRIYICFCKTELFILKEDETPTSIGGELRQFRLGGSPISFQDKASGGSQAWSVEECFAFDHAAARTPEAFLNCRLTCNCEGTERLLAKI